MLQPAAAVDFHLAFFVHSNWKNSCIFGGFREENGRGMSNFVVSFMVKFTVKKGKTNGGKKNGKAW